MENRSDDYFTRLFVVPITFFKSFRSPEKELVPYEYTIDKSIEMVKYMDLEKPLVLYFFGYKEHPSNESVQTVVSGQFLSEFLLDDK